MHILVNFLKKFAWLRMCSYVKLVLQNLDIFWKLICKIKQTLKPPLSKSNRLFKLMNF